MPSLSRCFMIIGIITVTLVMFSCSGTSPTYKPTLLDRNWGRSYETANYMQLLNPDAEKSLDPVLGLDGNAANHNVNKYRQSFKKTEQREIVNILKLQ
jgi:hypothetical protein